MKWIPGKGVDLAGWLGKTKEIHDIPLAGKVSFCSDLTSFGSFSGPYHQGWVEFFLLS